MRLVPRFPQSALATVLGLLCASATLGQSGPVVVRDIKVVPGNQGLSVQIFSSRPLSPEITRVEGPDRIVIDIPNAVLAGGPKRIPVGSFSVTEIRASQFKPHPPVARVVMELTAVRDYSVVTSGNKLAVWLRAPESEERSAGPRAPMQVPGESNTPQPVAVPTAASNAAIADIRTLSGPSSISADRNTAIVRLPRGGEVHVCPGTSLSVTPSQNGHDLMFGLSTGTMETHYNLGSAADLILTPDFRILLPGPGTFNFAVSADREGNTCVRSLEGNTAGVILSEMIGDATYEIHANEQAWFRSGRLQNASSVSPIACGCPVQMVPVMRAEESTPATSVKPHAPAETDLIAQAAPQGTAAAVTNRVPASSGRDLHVQVDAPFVFRATQPKVPAAPSVAHLRLLPRLTPEQLEVAPLAPTKIRYYRLQAGKIDKPERRGFFSRLGGVFSAIFR